jgi:hypothetical protein
MPVRTDVHRMRGFGHGSGGSGCVVLLTSKLVELEADLEIAGSDVNAC